MSYTVSIANEIGIEKKLVCVRRTTGVLYAFYIYNSDLYYKTSSDNGLSWSSQTKINGAYEVYGYSPSIALDSNDVIHIVYCGKTSTQASNPQILYRQLASSLGAIVEITDTPYDQIDPTIAVDSASTLHILWAGSSATQANKDLYHIYNDGSWSGIAKITADNTSEKPYIAPDSNSALHLVYSSTKTVEPLHIIYRKYEGDWSDEVIVDGYEEGGHNQSSPVILVKGYSIYIAWYGTSPDVSNYHIRFRYKHINWSEVIVVSDEAYNNSYPSLSYSARDGKLRIVWSGVYAGYETYLQLIMKEFKDNIFGSQINITADNIASNSFPSFMYQWTDNNKSILGYTILFHKSSQLYIYWNIEEFEEETKILFLKYNTKTGRGDLIDIGRGSEIYLDTDNFDNNLSNKDNTVQKAADTLDDIYGGIQVDKLIRNSMGFLNLKFSALLQKECLNIAKYYNLSISDSYSLNTWTAVKFTQIATQGDRSNKTPTYFKAGLRGNYILHTFLIWKLAQEQAFDEICLAIFKNNAKFIELDVMDNREWIFDPDNGITKLYLNRYIIKLRGHKELFLEVGDKIELKVYPENGSITNISKCTGYLDVAYIGCQDDNEDYGNYSAWRVI